MIRKLAMESFRWVAVAAVVGWFLNECSKTIPKLPSGSGNPLNKAI